MNRFASQREGSILVPTDANSLRLQSIACQYTIRNMYATPKCRHRKDNTKRVKVCKHGRREGYPDKLDG